MFFFVVLSRREDTHADLTDVKVDELGGLVGHVTGEVTTYEAVPAEERGEKC